MRALGFLLGSTAIAEAMRSERGLPRGRTTPDERILPLDEATLARWRAWAHAAPEADVRSGPEARPVTRPARRATIG